MAIQNLNQSTIQGSDSIPFFDNTNGCDRRASVASLLALVPASTNTTPTQYFAPAATGWSVTVAPLLTGQSMFLLITPNAGYAAGTIILPAVATLVDSQGVLVFCSQAVTTLTVNGNGATAVLGAPTTLAANGFFRLRYDIISKNWLRVA